MEIEFFVGQFLEALGMVRNSASTDSSNAFRAGLGRGSLMMRFHSASPFSSGRMLGRSSASCSRSFWGRDRMASSISFNVLILLYRNARLLGVNPSLKAGSVVL